MKDDMDYFGFGFMAGNGPPPLVCCVEDNFTGTNGDLLNNRVPDTTQYMSEVWALIYGTDCQIQSNKAYSNTAGWSLNVIESGVSDCVITSTGSAADRLPSAAYNSLVYRYVDTNNYWAVRWAVDELSKIHEVTGGSFISRDTAVGTAAWDTDYEQVMTLNGTSMSWTAEASGPLSYTSAQHQSASKHGIRGLGLLAAGSKFNNFKVEELP